MKLRKLGIFIGRFQIFHNAHRQTVERMFTECDQVLILIGSANNASNPLNPFTYEDRVKMIKASFPKDSESSYSKLLVAPLNDFKYVNSDWIQQVHEVVNKVKEVFGSGSPSLLKFSEIRLYGHKKDLTSEYLDWFPEFTRIETGGNPGQRDASTIRDSIFTQGFVDVLNQRHIPEATANFLAEWIAYDERFKKLKAWYDYEKKYKEDTRFVGVPYDPIFSTVDPIVVCMNHIALVERGSVDGQGLWALPGGFLNANEPIETALFRELKEETCIDVPPAILKNSLKEMKVFDDPRRSTRGRTITHAGLIVLREKTLPKIKGADDAKEAFWVNLSDLADPKTASKFFEDHWHIINYMRTRLAQFA